MNNTQSKPSFFQRMDPKYAIIAFTAIIVIIFVLYKTKKPIQTKEQQQWQQVGDGLQQYLEGVKK